LIFLFHDKLDIKAILQLGIGVAVGMLAYYFISNALIKRSEATSE
jgi:hypothetical protein